MTDKNAMLALVERWARYYNDDVTRLVQDCYAPDCKKHPRIARYGGCRFGGFPVHHRVQSEGPPFSTSVTVSRCTVRAVSGVVPRETISNPFLWSTRIDGWLCPAVVA